jgi:hypothetical protein
MTLAENLPPISSVVHLRLGILREFWKKFETVLMGHSGVEVLD